MMKNDTPRDLVLECCVYIMLYEFPILVRRVVFFPLWTSLVASNYFYNAYLQTRKQAVK